MSAEDTLLAVSQLNDQIQDLLNRYPDTIPDDAMTLLIQLLSLLDFVVNGP